MAQLKKKFIKDDAVGAAKIKLENNAALRARNFADSADVDILKLNASDVIEFLSVPQQTADGVNPNDLVRFSQLAGTNPTAKEQKITLGGGDITAQYVDLAFAVLGASAGDNSVSLFVLGGPIQEKAVDYSVSLVGGAGGVTRITFLGELATAGAAALIAGDKLIVQYLK